MPWKQEAIGVLIGPREEGFEVEVTCDGCNRNLWASEQTVAMSVEDPSFTVPILCDLDEDPDDPQPQSCFGRLMIEDT